MPKLFLCILILFGAAIAVTGEETQDAKASPLVHYDFVPKLKQLDPYDPVALRRHYDEVLLVTCLQGLVNRDEPRLFVRYNAEQDDFWFEKMTDPGEWLGDRKVERLSSLPELLAKFPEAAKGLVVWDERVPATSNVAASVAGVEDLLAVRYDTAEGSLYQQLTSGPDAIPVRRSFLAEDGSPLFTGHGAIPETKRESTGSAKNDAYIWLLENYIKPGKTSARVLGFYVDGFWLKCWQASALENHTLNNLDFIIANRGAILDLNVWEDEATVDDPGQKPGTDLRTFREILAAQVERTQQKEMIAVFGFVSWAHKYTTAVSNGWHAGGKHDPVPTEWEWIEILTAYNAYAEPDALGYSSFPNASLYRLFSVPEFVPQDATPTREKLINDGVLDGEGRLLPVNYYAHYQGDYDCAAWVYEHFPMVLSDPARGSLPLSWAINPNLAERFAFGMYYLRKHAAPHEIFVAGEGAGYVNPSLLQAPRPEPGLPDALDLWVEHSKKIYRQWDIDVTGFSIDGNTPSLDNRGLDGYAEFSSGGLGLLRAPDTFGLHGNMPYLRMMTDLPGHKGGASMDVTVTMLESFFEPVEQTPNFVMVRSILQVPSYYAEIEKRLESPGHLPNKLVDLPTLFWLVREYESDPKYKNSLPSFADHKCVTASPDSSQGLRIRRVGDGGGARENVGEEPMWRVGGGGQRYLYLDVANDFAKSLGEQQGARVRVTFLDRWRGTLGIEYDSSDASAAFSGMYKAGTPVEMLGNGEIRTVEFALPDAQFSSRQNAGSDFRLDAGGNPILIQSVEVIRGSSENP